MVVRVYENQALSMKGVYEWFARFRENRESASHNRCSERPVTSINDENIQKPLHSQYRQTIHGKKGLAQIEYLPFSPDFNPPDFFLLPRLKYALKGKRFNDISDVQGNMRRLFNSISKEDFLQNFQDMCSISQWGILMRSNYLKDSKLTFVNN
ncbi:hypothetical protein TNCV_2923381 [Trichonephila clavipes]|nr:hypothetical protein TNCV_2923381 [Trichonephila clavipes]